MEVDYGLHFQLALWSFVSGAFLGAIYDLFRIGRIGRDTNRVLLFFADIAFSLICALTLMLLFFNLSFGRMRGYAFVIALLGFLAWRYTVGLLFVKLCLRVMKLISSVLAMAKRRASLLLFRLYEAGSTRHYCRKTVSRARHGFGRVVKIRKEFRREEKKHKKKQSDNQSGVHSDIHIPVRIGDKPAGADEGAPRGAR